MQHKLTPREIQVLKLLIQGLTNSEIANILKISSHTIKTHVQTIIQKYRVKNRIQAAIIAKQSGI